MKTKTLVEHIIFRNDLCAPEEYGFVTIDENENEVPVTDWEECNDQLSNWLSDEKGNLDVEVRGCIVGFASLGLWYGRRNGGRVYGDTVNSIFDVMEDYNKFWADRYNVRASLAHHDGTNYVLFRVAPDSETAEHLVDKIAYGGMTEEQFRKRTKSLRPYVAKVFGW